MKKVIGIVLLVLALVSIVNAILKSSRPGSSSRSRNEAYESGRKVGMFLAPVLLGGAGLWLVLSSGRQRQAPPGVRHGGSKTTPVKPWFKTPPAIIGFSVAGGAVGLVLLVAVLGEVLRAARRNSRISSPPQPRAPGTTVRTGITQVGPYKVGGSVEANWGGKWTPGTIASINPGGFTLMVQLEDARWPHPIVLSTNQLRLK